MDNYIGKKIEGRYLIHELIGVGGMANVYKGVDTTDGKTVAVKVLREEFYDNEEFLRRFKNESKAIAMLSHPNIIKVYDVCFSNRMRSIIMEYVDGITLKEYMDEQSPLSWKETLHFIPQILRALSHAHAKGIVHRDIKPQNVMLLNDAQIKITDFGIARFARSESRTITDRAIGSVHYISPEQARGGHTDQRADLYSVGVMMFEMLTGQLPFDAESPVSVALKQIELKPPSPRGINPEVPEALEEITMRALQKDPERRYQSADEMLRDIQAFLHDPSVHFEYQYLTDEQLEQERFKKKLRNAKQNQRPGAGPTRKGKRMKQTPPSARSSRDEQQLRAQRSRAQGEQHDQPPEEEQGGSILMALAGITAAFVVISVVFIGAMLLLNNPLEKVPDITMPNLTGVKYDTIKNGEYEFAFEVEDNQYNELYERGAIISHRPKAGTKVKKNAVVRLVISNGTKVVTVPNLIGLEETAAYRELAELDLEYQKVEVFSDLPVGSVVATDPGYGSEISASTVVKLHISMGPENKVVTVPRVTGMSLNDARRLLEQNGLSVGGISYVTSDEAEDTVLAQDPAESSQVVSGSYVNLNVAGGERTRTLVTLHVPLPSDVTDIVKLQAMFDGRVLKEEQVQPSTALFWKPGFEGRGVAKIFILYNDFLYQTYEVNFNTGGYVLVEDNSAMHQ